MALNSMESCGFSKDTVIGYACRRIPGKEKESCYLWREAQGESRDTINRLELFVKNHPECPFQNETLENINFRGLKVRGFP